MPALLAGLSLWLFVLPAAGQGVDNEEAYELSLTKGLVEFGDERYEQAAVFFADAMKAKPGDPEAGYHLGQTLLRLKKFEAAEAIFQQVLQAEPGAGRARLGLGIAQYHRARYREALASFNAAETIMPDDPLVYYYQGLTYHELEEFAQSPPRFLRAMTLSPDLAPIAQYYSGVAYYRRGVLDEARTSFESAIALQPESDHARSARELLAQVARPAPEGRRRWSLNANVGMEYDTNVVLLPGGTQPPGGSTGISGQADYRSVLSASGEFRAIQTDTWAVGASYGVYQTFHAKLHGFDIEDHSPTFYIRRQAGPLGISGQYIYNCTLVGRSPYLISHTAQTVLTLTESSWTFTQVQLRYQNKDFQDGRFPLNSARDGKNWLAGVTQYVLFADKQGRARVGYTFDTDNTGGGSPTVAGPSGTLENADWDYSAYRISAGLELPPLWTMNLDLAFD